MKIQFTIIPILFLGLCPTYAQKTIDDKTLRTIDSISLQDVVKKGPGIATGIVVNGKIVYEKYAGYADLGDSTLISEKSRFNIASNGKQFTALAILTLVDEEKLKLSDDIRKYLPTLYPNLKQKISIENLLNHSSGIRDIYDLLALKGITWWKYTYSNSDVLSILSRQTDLNFEPGEKHLYSNSNYILLAEIVGKVSGTTFTAYTNRIFKKLGLPNTAFVDDYTLIKGPVAKPYFNFDKWTGYDWITNIHGDGNLFSTLGDQLQFEKIVQSRKSIFLPAELIAASQQSILASDVTSYGYGLEFSKYRGADYAYHEGSTGAWKATTLRFPNERISIVTLTNSGKAVTYTQSRQVADVLLDIKQQKDNFLIAPLRTGQFLKEKEIVGTYQDDQDFTFRFELRGSDLYLIRSGRNDIRLEREADNIFHQWNDRAFKQEFKLNDQNQMEVTAYYTTHPPYTLKRENVDWKNFDFKALQGTFLNSETGIKISIKWESENVYSVSIGNNALNGILITPQKMMLGSYNIEIVKTSSETISQLKLNGSRIKNVTFNRINE